MSYNKYLFEVCCKKFKAIDGGLMKKHEIINHLEWLIHTRSAMKNMENAVLEWRSDLHFLLNYNLDNQRTIWANRILIK